MKIDAKLSGFNQAKDRLLYSAKAYAAAVDASLYQAGEIVKGGAVRRVPVDTGRLRSTAYVSPVTLTGFSRYVQVGFGTNYAAKQHWALHFRHTVGEALFLLKSFNEVAANWERTMAALVRRNLRLGFGMGALPNRAPAGRERDARGRFKKRGT